jgi:two-component sensor histidine kinase
LNLDQAVPLGLIINELVTNSLKHSRKDRLEIDFSATKSNDLITISLKDNGSGITKEQFRNSDSFGISMIKSLTEQINGKLNVDCIDGTQFQLKFMAKETEK